MSVDLLAAVLASCDRHADAPALTGPDGVTMSYRALGARIAGTGRGLIAGGMREGDRVLFSVRPSPAGVVLALGIAAAGGTVVFADPGAGPELFAARLALTRPRWAAAESLLYAAARGPVRRLARRRGVLLPDYAALPVRHIYAGRWLPGIPRGALPARRLTGGGTVTEAAPDREVLVVFTSGTTGAPRAVVHTRGSLGASLSVLANACALAPGHVVHTDQLMLGLPALVAGAHWTMPPYGFAPAADPTRYAAGLAGATHAFCTPADLTALLDMMDAGRRTVPESLRCLLVGGAPVLAPLVKRALDRLPGKQIRAVYGMTEILPVAVATAEGKAAYDGPGDPVGTPLPGVSVRIAPDGELFVRGANLCRGYLGEPPLTEHATGDLARLVDGQIVLVGRAKDMVIRGRTNIYPGLYEPTIARLPGVGAAAILGIADEVGAERVVLVVSPGSADGPPRLLPGHPLADTVARKLPGVIDAAALPDEVVVASRLPVAGRTGKPDRAELRRLVGGG